MAVVDRLILRLAVYQLLHVPDMPPAVVIDESVELARRYGGDESSRFVNGVLDAMPEARRGEARPLIARRDTRDVRILIPDS